MLSSSVLPPLISNVDKQTFVHLLSLAQYVPRLGGNISCDRKSRGAHSVRFRLVPICVSIECRLRYRYNTKLADGQAAHLAAHNIMPPNTILFPQVRSNVISTYAKDISLVDPRDKDTPDRVVARNPNLIRLTGKHPFNAGKFLFRFSLAHLAKEIFV